MASELYRSIFEKGEAKGWARRGANAYTEMITQVLMRRMGFVDPSIRKRLGATSSVETLKAWFNEAVAVTDFDTARRLVDTIRKTTTS